MKPELFKYYQHRYGGVYSVIATESMNTEDQSIWVVYRHEWPFDPNKVYHRRYEEWCDGRFKELTPQEVKYLFGRDRVEFQNEITAKKEAAKR